MKKQLTLGILLALLVGLTVGYAPAASAKVTDVILATTTSTADTGLLDYLLPIFEAKTGYKVKPIAVGTGQALAMGEKGEADVLLVHAPASEKPLVDKGLVIDYKLVMHNDFVVVGPPDDPAKIKGMKVATAAFKAVEAKNALFVSRGDDSGTHKAEKTLWTKAGLKPAGSWYQQSGAGMGQTLLIASEKGGYTLTDRGTYLAQKKNLRLDVLVEGDKDLLNIYHVAAVNPAKFEKVNYEGAKAFVEFIVSPQTQKLIADYGKEKYGSALFFPDAGKSEDDLGK